MFGNFTRIGLEPTFHPPRILVADDEPALRESLGELLRLRGYEVTLATGGQDAVSHIERQYFDAILLDLFMPDMTGHEVMDFLASHGIDSPTIVVSGDSSIDAAIRALRRGAYDFLRKPYAPEELLRRVENALARGRLQKENSTVLKHLEQSEKWYRFLVNHSPDFIYTLDPEGRFTFVNDRAQPLLGFTREELIGQHWSTVIHEDDVESARFLFNERRADERAARNIEIRLIRKPVGVRRRLAERRFVSVEVTAMGMYESPESRFPGRFLGTYGVAKDITERKQAEETIQFQAYHDLLTGLPNRLLFKDRLGLAIAQARRADRKLAVMFLDLDRFKVVNDSLGHVVGDDLLMATATRLRAILRQGDTLARLGGDEFTLLLPDLPTPGVADSIVDKIHAEMARPFHLDGREIYTSVSIGVSVFPDHGETMETLIQCAEIAMYHAKSAGRGAHCFFAAGMSGHASKRLSLEADLRRALERGELVLHFQPQLLLTDRRIVGFEALLRWNHPTLGLIGPGEFVPLAEETGLIVPIGEWVLHAACAQLRTWENNGLPPVRVGVNIAPRQIEHPRFVEMVRGAIDTHSVHAGRLEVEITEGAIVHDMEHTVVKLGQISSAGVSIAIDDFGTGYSSLNYLKKFPIHTIKIDQSFVADIEQDHDAPIVKAIVAMAKGLHLNLIAEGVETEQQLEYLKNLDCNEMQGFLFSPAIAADEASRLLMREGETPRVRAG